MLTAEVFHKIQQNGIVSKYGSSGTEKALVGHSLGLLSGLWAPGSEPSNLTGSCDFLQPRMVTNFSLFCHLFNGKFKLILISTAFNVSIPGKTLICIPVKFSLLEGKPLKVRD